MEYALHSRKCLRMALEAHSRTEGTNPASVQRTHILVSTPASRLEEGTFRLFSIENGTGVYVMSSVVKYLKMGTAKCLRYFRVVSCAWKYFVARELRNKYRLVVWISAVPSDESRTDTTGNGRHGKWCLLLLRKHVDERCALCQNQLLGGCELCETHSGPPFDLMFSPIAPIT